MRANHSAISITDRQRRLAIRRRRSFSLIAAGGGALLSALGGLLAGAQSLLWVVALSVLTGVISGWVANALILQAEQERRLRHTLRALEPAREARQQLYQELVALSNYKSDFLARMSHELRTPLNSIVGYSELLLTEMYGELNEEQCNRLERVLRNGRHLLGIINDILDLSRIDAGRLELAYSSGSADMVLELALAPQRRAIEE